MTPLADTPHPIGSDFASPGTDLLLDRDVAPPWELTPATTSYVQTGRGALRLIARSLSSQGYDTVLIPAFLCESMILPFDELGWRIIPVPMTHQLTMDPDALQAAISSVGSTPVILTAEYFGCQPQQALVDALIKARSLGTIIIDDETHRIFAPGGIPADYRVASLRKLLPLADGAYIGTSTSAIPIATGPDRQEGAARWIGMDALAFQPLSALHEQFQQANKNLEECIGIRPPTARSMSVLRHLNYPVMAAKRIDNSNRLMAQLAGICTIINPPDGNTIPSHLVIRVPEPRRVQASLAAMGVFCPIHWPQPPRLRDVTDWPHDILSIPIDHRYDRADMDRIAAALRGLVEKSR